MNTPLGARTASATTDLPLTFETKLRTREREILARAHDPALRPQSSVNVAACPASAAIGSRCDFKVINKDDDFVTVITKAPLFFVFCAIIAVVNLAFTLTAGKIFKFNLEELLVAVNANLSGAPSAAAMATSAGWPRLVLPAILVGIWGYVIGTRIGVMVVEMLLR